MHAATSILTRYASRLFGRTPVTRPVRRADLRRRDNAPVYAAGEVLEERLLLSGFGPEDGAYIVEAWSGSYQDVKIQPSGQKIVAAGSLSINNPDGTFLEARMAVARYDAAGNADATFGTAGHTAPALGTFIENGYDLVLQSDGKAVVSGEARTAQFGSPMLAVARFNTNGALDGSFGSGGWNTFDVSSTQGETGYGVGLQSTGKIVASGGTSGSSTTSAFVARFTTSGAIDSGKGAFGQVSQGKATGAALSTFGGTGNNFADLSVQPDDKVVAVGGINGNGSGRLVVARYTAVGVLDTTFNTTGYSVLLPAGLSMTSGASVAVQSNGKIVVAGSSIGADGWGDMFIARFNANGTLDISFGAGTGYVQLDIDGASTLTDEGARGIVIQPDGKIVAAGYEYVPGTAGNVLVARLNTNGSLDTTFGTGGFKIGAPPAGHSFDASAVTLQSDGSIIVAGNDSSATPETTFMHPLLMRFSGAATTAGAHATSGSTSLAAATSPTTQSIDQFFAQAGAATDGSWLDSSIADDEDSTSVRGKKRK